MTLLLKYLTIIFNLLVALVAIFNILNPIAVNPNWEQHVSFVVVFWALYFAVVTYLHYKTLYLFTNAYLVPLCLFHLGIVIPNAFNMFENFSWDTNSSFQMWLEYACWYVVLSLACVSIGVGMSMRERKNIINNELLQLKIKQTYEKIYLDGVGLFVASLIFFMMAIISFGNLLNYSRADFFHGIGDTRGLGLFMMCLPSSAILLMIGANCSARKLIASIVSLAAFLIFLLSGYRSAALFPALVGVVIWTKVKNKIPLIVSISVIIFVIFVIPVVGSLRSVGPYNKITSSHVEKSIQKAAMQNTFIELGGTLGVLAHTLRLVPDVDEYRFGMTYIKALRDSIPNIMPEMSKSYRKESSNKAMLNHKYIGQMTVPSDWITYRIAPDKYHKGEGVGFSAIGEPYLNFGIVGVIIFFITIGYCLGRLDDTYLLDKPNLLLFICAIFWFLIRTVRNDFSNLIKPAFFLLIIILIWRLFIFIFFKNISKKI